MSRVVSLTAVAALTLGGLLVQAQTPGGQDPRVGLKAGFRDPGVAASGLELLTNLPKPEGFFDPENPAGEPLPKMPEGPPPPPPPADADKPAPPRRAFGGLNFANSDLAFSGTHLFVGNFAGFTVYDVSNPATPTLMTAVVCPGGQGDVSVHGNLLFMSVEQPRGRIDCGVNGVEDAVSKERFRGVRIFDISDVKMPKQVAAVQTCRGSHTHTLVTNPKDPSRVYVYGSGTSVPRSKEELADCDPGDITEKDPNPVLFSIDVIEVPVARPQEAKIVSRPRIFADEKGNIAGLWMGGTHGPDTQETAVTNQCHDITAFPEVGLAAGACSGNGILLDISDPVQPRRLDAVSDPNFAYWHSATFNNDGTKVVFTDEWGGGMRPRCLATDKPNWGANAIFDIVDRKLVFRSYYKLPAPQTETENCVAHNGSLVPVPGRDIMVQAWYQGGISVFDFTDSSKPKEIAFFDRGPLHETELITGGQWSTYWYNGAIYGAEIARGLDVLKLVPTADLSQNEIDAASEVVVPRFNVQHQDKVTWKPTKAVALAYTDQLARSGAIPQDRAGMLIDAIRTGNTSVLSMASSRIAERAAAVSGADAARLRSLAQVLDALK